MSSVAFRSVRSIDTCDAPSSGCEKPSRAVNANTTRACESFSNAAARIEKLSSSMLCAASHANVCGLSSQSEITMRANARSQRALRVRARVRRHVRAERGEHGAHVFVVQAERAKTRLHRDDALGRVALAHAAQYLQHTHDSRERIFAPARRARRDVEADVVVALAEAALDLEEEARLADAVIAADRENAALAVASRRRAPRPLCAARLCVRRSARALRSDRVRL